MVSIRFASPRCQTWPASLRLAAIRGRLDSLVLRLATKRGRIVRKRSRSPVRYQRRTHTLCRTATSRTSPTCWGDLVKLPGGPRRAAGGTSPICRGNFAKHPGTVRSARHASRRPPSLASPPARPDVALGQHVRPPALDKPHKGAQRATLAVAALHRWRRRPTAPTSLSAATAAARHTTCPHTRAQRATSVAALHRRQRRPAAPTSLLAATCVPWPSTSPHTGSQRATLAAASLHR